MTEPDDPFDTWLHANVEPLRPPPGTFDRIRHQAKRRKRHRALISAASAGAAAAVIAAAVVAVPKLVPSLHSSPRPAAAGSAPARPTFGPSRHATAPTTPSVPVRTSSQPVVSTGPRGVPSDFAPTSITFMSLFTGWVIGQAPGCGRTYCTTVAKTTNYGRSWTSMPAPRTGPPDGSTGVSQIRFLDAEEGWAFGPQLYETHNGGQSWQQVNTYGFRVTGLETVGAMAYATFAQCTGTGTDYATNCTHVSVYSSPAGSDTWTPVPGVGNSFGYNNGYVSAKIVLTHGEGYFYAPDGLLYVGATSPGATWQPVAEKQMPCEPFNAQSDGQPSGGQLAASAPGDLFMACPVGPGGAQEQAFSSTDGGQSWQLQGTFPVSGSATSLAAGTQGSGVLALATTGGIYTSSDNGQSWKQSEEGPPGGFSYVGMTNAQKGVAVPAQPAQSNSVWYTQDAGNTWTQSSITNP